ncbi:MAG: hypothetical protein FJ027_24925 [Candidatus Rokubacteria bacterium]|nr:hypothetical protein [Candidatus Rokubacteria bacterium]
MLRVLGVLMIAAAALGPAPAGAQTPTSANLLHNWSFEEGTYHTSMSNFIANGWGYWYEGRDAADPRGHLNRPGFDGGSFHWEAAGRGAAAA